MYSRSLMRRIEALQMNWECLAARSKVPEKRIGELMALKCPEGPEWEALCEAVGVGPLQPPTTPSEYRAQQAQAKARRICASDGKGFTSSEFERMIASTAQELLAEEDSNRVWLPL